MVSDRQCHKNQGIIGISFEIQNFNNGILLCMVDGCITLTWYNPGAPEFRNTFIKIMKLGIIEDNRPTNRCVRFFSVSSWYQI